MGNKTVNKGGRGKSEDLRNEAMVVLHAYNSERFSPSALGRLFGIDRSTASRNIGRDREKYLGARRVSVIPR